MAQLLFESNIFSFLEWSSRAIWLTLSRRNMKQFEKEFLFWHTYVWHKIKWLPFSAHIQSLNLWSNFLSYPGTKPSWSFSIMLKLSIRITIDLLFGFMCLQQCGLGWSSMPSWQVSTLIMWTLNHEKTLLTVLTVNK